MQYEGIARLEYDDISMIWLKVKLSCSNYLNIDAIYCQWKLPAEMRTGAYRPGLPAQLDRFSRICEAIKGESSGGTPYL